MIDSILLFLFSQSPPTFESKLSADELLILFVAQPLQYTRFTQSLSNNGDEEEIHHHCLAFFMPPNFRKRAFVVVLHEKSLLRLSEEALYRGPERIRTAVGAFAELCLATRPQDLF